MQPDRRQFLVAGGAAVAGLSSLRADDYTIDAKRFITAHVSKLKPLEVDANNAWWDANTTGSDAAYARKEETQNAINALLSSPITFNAIKKIHATGGIEDKAVARQVELLYLQYLEKQIEPELLKKMTAKANAVEKAFNVFRAKVDGKEMTENDVRKVLKESSSSEQRQKVWEASKEVGKVVEKDLLELATMRNEAAKGLEYKDFMAMSLAVNEQDPAALLKLFDELDELTREPFRRAKAEIDAQLAAKVGKKPADLMPWDYQDPFFQEAPAAFDIDAIFKDAKIIDICRIFYRGIGLPVNDVLARSDLYSKIGKSPHAFCTDIDRDGDVRVLANIMPTEYWMSTMLHELGHAVYSSKNIPAEMPYLLRAEAHILTTEGVAMQFQKFSKNRQWLESMGVRVPDAKAFDVGAAKMLRNELLIFSRWCQVMLRFEKGLYENPKQDLNALWWGLVEQYQEVKKPKGRSAPDYASKIHICSAPVYYHNYMMGQLFASQVHRALAAELNPNQLPGEVIYVSDKNVGKWMTEKVFAPGRTMKWNELTKHATGEDLSPKAFAMDFQA